MAAVKFCGLTRPEDAAAAAAVGASYLGVIFAGGPRHLTVDRARDVLGAGGGARRVGVFAAQTPEEVADTAAAAGLDVVQLHGDPDAAAVAAVRARFAGEVWAVVRVSGDELPACAGELYAVSDVVLLDPRVEGRLGGTGVPLAWAHLRPPVDRLRAGARARTALAGGLGPGNVARAAAALAPDIVDVSSGVETSPGIKDHALLRAFMAAVRTSGREA